MYLWNKVEYGITEQGRCPQGDQEGIEVLEIRLELLVLGDGNYEQPNERCQANQQHHQKTIAVCYNHQQKPTHNSTT